MAAPRDARQGAEVIRGAGVGLAVVLGAIVGALAVLVLTVRGLFTRLRVLEAGGDA
jgi:hypothetical protein